MSLELVLADLAEPGSEPRQRRLYRLLKAAILDGRLAPGLRLPATRQLAADLGMARNGVLFSCQQLIAEGFLDADRRGTRVAALPVARPQPAALPNFPASLSQRGTALPPLASGDSLLPFAPGSPDLNAFPWSAWAACLRRAWEGIGARQLSYAEAGGEPVLRQAVADFLRARRGVACTPEQVFIVAGGQVALDACARLLADTGDTVWLENPAYPAARNAMLAAGLRVVDVAVDENGMAPPADLWQSAPPRLVYLTPSHQYPLGSVLCLERRLDFLNRVRPGEAWLIEDDYDGEFNHARPGDRPLPAIQGLRPEAPVVYVGTFSKLLYPGLRLAYLVLPRWAAGEFGTALGRLLRGGQPVEQRALARFLENARLTRHLRQMAPIYRERQQVLRMALQQHFGAAAEILGGRAGLHLVLRLPAGPADTDIVAAAAARGVTVRALSRYYAGGQGDNGLLLGYGMADVAHIPQLVARLADAVASLR
jgi:GntR family transcriptional regulator/MocR family aminotransferase